MSERLRSVSVKCAVCGAAEMVPPHRAQRYRTCSIQCASTAKSIGIIGTRPRRPERERFWEKVEMSSGCWDWTGHQSKQGYGAFRRDGKTVKAHRVSFEYAYGDCPPLLDVCHRCDRPCCVNPAHLFLGTAKDNADDMIAKGRKYQVRGELVHRAKLTASAVAEIRDLASQGIGVREIGRRFGVVHGTITQILQQKTWRHVQ